MAEFDGSNPFRPGAGQKPLYLAGRTHEHDVFAKHLDQKPLLQNVILTGLRGVGKTVLLESLRPLAQRSGWLWAGNEVSESSSLTEERVAKRLITDLSTLLGPILIKTQSALPFGFAREVEEKHVPLSFDDLWNLYDQTPGLTDDKLKAVLSRVRVLLRGGNVNGIVFAYDEAQNLSDHSGDKEFPLSILLDVFASLQRDHSEIPILLVLTGLPTLFPKLNEARTYTERMFTVLQLDKLSDEQSKMAILKPIEIAKSPLRFSSGTVDEILKMSGGYPYFLQYICKEVFDAWIGRINEGEAPSVPSREIESKLDQDFFAPRWDRATPRQQDFMRVIACLDSENEYFSAQEIAKESKRTLKKGFSPSHSIQLLQALNERGLVYRNKHGQYSFAVPMMAGFIRRQAWNPSSQPD
jgi:hypothetical protein